MGNDRGPVANTGSADRGSALEGNCGVGHTEQPDGHSIGTHSFPQTTGAQGFGHAAHVRSGALRLSGHPGAHRIGRRK